MTARILVVDDIDANVRLLEAKLQAEYYDVLTASDGERALEMAAIEKPDLVLLDVMMPHVDGWEMLRRIQDQYGAGAIPVVMFSGQADQAAQSQAASSGAQAFVGKPFDLQQLIEQTKQIAPV